MTKKFYIETFGCTFNEADSRFISHSLKELNYYQVNDPNEADLIIINTCSVRSESENKAIEALKRYGKVADQKGSKILVTGCMVKLNPFKLYEIRKDAIYVTPSLIKEIPKIVNEQSENNLLIGGSDRLYDVIPKYEGGVTYILPISSGCLGSCTFCSVRYTRGTLYSYRPSEIKKAFIEAVEGGAKEIYITSQDNACYGLDIQTDLCELIEGLLEYKTNKEFKIRIGMFTPWFAFRLVNKLKKIYHNKRVYKFCHVPVQSGDDRVLKDMQRPHTVSEFIEFINELRSEHPDLFIATDIIVGFPIEDEEAFENTVKLVEKLEFDKVHIAQYSPRPFTKAAFYVQLPDSVKKQRSRILTKIVDEISYKRNLKFLGKKLNVLIIGEGEKGYLEGRAYDYRCVIVKSEEKSLIGKFIDVEVKDVTPHYLIASPLN